VRRFNPALADRVPARSTLYLPHYVATSAWTSRSGGSARPPTRRCSTRSRASRRPSDGRPVVRTGPRRIQAAVQGDQHRRSIVMDTVLTYVMDQAYTSSRRSLLSDSQERPGASADRSRPRRARRQRRPSNGGAGRLRHVLSPPRLYAPVMRGSPAQLFVAASGLRDARRERISATTTRRRLPGRLARGSVERPRMATGATGVISPRLTNQGSYAKHDSRGASCVGRCARRLQPENWRCGRRGCDGATNLNSSSFPEANQLRLWTGVHPDGPWRVSR